MSRPASVGEDRPRRLVVLAGPTAVGKGTVSAYVRDHFPEVWLSVSMTTRAPRTGESDGVHYHFVTPQVFDDLVARGIAAGDLVRVAVARMDGRGGGRPEMAQGKGARREGLAAALEAIRDAVRTNGATEG